MKRLTQEHKWKRTIEWLRLQFPGRAPIKVRRQKLQEVCGDCTYCNCPGDDDEEFYIRIDKSAPYRVKLDTLFHEWAHALSWFARPGVDDHSGEWGLAFADIYSAFIRWNYGKGDK